MRPRASRYGAAFVVAEHAPLVDDALHTSTPRTPRHGAPSSGAGAAHTGQRADGLLRDLERACAIDKATYADDLCRPMHRSPMTEGGGLIPFGNTRLRIAVMPYTLA